MSDQAPFPGGGDLQFEHVSSGARKEAPGVTCAVCQSNVVSEYYDVNGSSVCASCRERVEDGASPARGLGPLVKAGLFGLGAGVVGAAIYYAVIALTHLEIGIVAILIGYMVGWAVRRGAGGRGGRRFQVMAVLLTYLAVGLAYMPIAIKGAMEHERSESAAAGRVASPSGTTPSSTEPTTAPTNSRPERPSALGLAIGLLFIAGLTVAMPLLVVFGSMPSGLISAFIIFIGMRQAWAMTAAVALTISGPHRVGVAPPVAGA